MFGLAEKLSLPLLALFWIGTILVMTWIIFRPPPRPRRTRDREDLAPKQPRGPLTASQKVALTRRRRLAR
jgi:hypothetical protein